MRSLAPLPALALALLVLPSAKLAGLAHAQEVQFNRDVRPILSDRCFFCHGPDAKKREADLRLDTREDALAAGAFKLDQPNESELIRRVTSQDPEVRMPPPGSKLEPLTPREVDTLKRWIAQGAPYQPHWSFIPIDETPLPAPTNKTTVTASASAVHPIDQFVRARLAEKKLQQQPPADRTTLIRRLSFDITGLPPAPEEVRAFVSDSSPEAYERLVDRLLASDRYGERMTVDWLDVARYADSYGFQVDREREMWPWRDWVIKAFNQNLPYDQFITWQIAGDLLPNPTQDQVLATAFNRLHQQESEGGSVEEEYRVEYVCDRVQTVATAFLGLTFECARCHDHKYDPVTQRDYYGLFATMHNIDEAGLYSYFTPSPPTPTLWLTDAATETKLQSLADKVRELEKQSQQVKQTRRRELDPWLTQRKAQITAPEQTSAEWQQQLTESITAARLAGYSFDERQGNEVANLVTSEPTGDAEGEKEAAKEDTAEGKAARNQDRKAARKKDAKADSKADAKADKAKSAAGKPAKIAGDNQLVAGKFGKAIQFTGDDPVDLPLGNFARHQPFTVSLWLKTPDVKDRAVIFHRSRAWTDAASRGYELLIEDGRLKWSLIHFWPGNAISIAARQALPVDQWQHVTVSYDGSSRADGLAIYVNGRLVETEVIKDKLTKEITGGGGDNIALAERFRDRGFKGGAIDEFMVYGRALSRLEALALFDMAQAAKELSTVADSKSSASAASLELVEEYYLNAIDKGWSEHMAALEAARGESMSAGDAVKEIMVMRELEVPKTAYILNRGEYNQRREAVPPGVPEWLLPLPADAPKNRLGLARWLTDPRHPLTARVAVNRVWQSLFGRGLVKTSEDFGSQGSRPLYPELLDWLAGDFIRSGWDMKRLVKTIVMSDTYRQRSWAPQQEMADDPDNEWLARGPRFRLPAEMIRDNALAAAGLLKDRLGGPPVNPYEMSEAFKPAKPSEGDSAFRRSLYTNWRRTGPPPALLAFDAPRRAVCIAKRERTDSPLQALILLNGVQYVEAARVLGQALHKQTGGDVPQMIEQGMLRALSRPADETEQKVLAQLYRDQLAYFTEHTSEATELLKVGSTPRDETIPIPQAAAATVLAQVMLNHDECVVKR